jgi:lipoprotein signal peptidase
MNKNIILPVLISIIQILSFGHLYYVQNYGNSHIPVALIELIILSFLNIIMLIGIYFFIFRLKNKISLWAIPICLAILMNLTTMTVCATMFFNKYN